MNVSPESQAIQINQSLDISDLIDTNEDSKLIDKDFHQRKTKKICLRKSIQSDQKELDKVSLELNNTTASIKTPDDSLLAIQSPQKDPNNDLLNLESEIKVSRKLLCFQTEPQVRQSLEVTHSKQKLIKNFTQIKPKKSKDLS